MRSGQGFFWTFFLVIDEIHKELTYLPKIYAILKPIYIQIDVIAVAVVRSCEGNHKADITGGAEDATGPATPFSMAQVCINLF